MTTVQIVGIAVASAVVVLLVIALLVTRRGGERREEPPAATPSGSFLDDTPSDSLSRLGKQVQPVEDVTLDPGAHRDVPAGPAVDVAAAFEGLSPATSTTPAESEITGEVPRPESTDAPSTASFEPAAEASAEPAPAAPAGLNPAATEPAAAGEPVRTGVQTIPLSDIIVTTSSKMVDLQDPEVRRMLTDLVTFEIDQATQFRQQGQIIDAVLQLTEAEKISRALGMHESAQHIHDMMHEMRGQT